VWRMLGAFHDEKTLEDLPSEGRRPTEHDDLHIVLECDRPLAGSTRHCIDEIDQVVFRRGRERRVAREQADGTRRLLVDVPDSRMSSLHATMQRVEGRWLLDDADSRNGSYVQGRRVQRAQLTDGSIFQFGHTHFLFRSRELPAALVEGPRDVASTTPRESTVGTMNHEHRALLGRMVDAARRGVAVLFVGEAGSGKDSLARAVHAVSGNRATFVTVPCVLLGRGRDTEHPAGNVAAQLTDVFARAAGGTLYLDGIEGLNPEAQMALLPLLQSQRRSHIATVLSSVRSSEPRPQVPRIAADLLAELGAFTLPLPSLRDRREDLGMLVAEILARAGARDPASITMDPLMGQALLQHDWPYNLSELDSCIRSAITMSSTGRMRWSPPTLGYRRPAGSQAAETGGSTAQARSLPSSESRLSATSSEPDAEFAQYVRRALRCNLSVSGLQKNGLLGSHMVLEATDGSLAATSTVPALRGIFRSALDSLAASSPRGAKQSRVLQLTFIEPTSTQQEAADRLAMAFGTYRRYVTSALAELTSILWFLELSARSHRDRGGLSGRKTG
jgi:Sigma-54 interaction domain/FHA domain